MPVHADEDFLDQIFSALAITYRPIDEVDEPSLIPLNQLIERALLAAEERRDHSSVVHQPELVANSGSGCGDQTLTNQSPHAPSSSLYVVRRKAETEV